MVSCAPSEKLSSLAAIGEIASLAPLERAVFNRMVQRLCLAPGWKLKKEFLDCRYQTVRR